MNPSPNFYFMKPILNPMLFIFIVILSAVSCNKDELFVDTTADTTVIDTPTDSTTVGDGTVNDNNPIVTTTIPCDFSLDTVLANDTVIINCILDLGGQTFNLPTGVSIIYEGGDLINGTLNFSDSSIISGELLNSSVTLGGSTPQLKDATFQFYPGRWEIVEGPTTSDIALRNRNILEDMFLRTKSMGATTFSIDKMDAYFEVTKVTSTTSNQNWYPSVEAINIPSDFNLVMTDNTILRLQPNSRGNSGVLMAVRDVSNVTVTGGVLYGDRNEHVYNNVGEDGQLLFMIHGAQNIVLDGIKMTMGSAGGLNINGLNFSYQPDYNPSFNILVKNCVFDNNRRMNTSITDGYNIIIENNTYLNAGQPNAFSEGGNVGYAINIEALRARDANGDLLLYERAYDITIRNNMERGSRIGAVVITIGENVTIENNDFESKVNTAFTSGSKIKNNTFTASTESAKAPAINIGGVGETVFNNEVSGNTITGYGVAISAYYRNLRIFDNIINDCGTGIQIKSFSDSEIFNNTITSTQTGSKGIMAHVTDVNNVNIYNNNIDVKASILYFVNLNQNLLNENYIVNVYDNNFISTAAAVFSNASGVVFNNNISSSRVQIANSSKIKVVSNEINSTNGHGIAISGESFNIEASGNTISVPTGSTYQCVYIANTTNINQVLNQGNSCN